MACGHAAPAQSTATMQTSARRGHPITQRIAFLLRNGNAPDRESAPAARTRDDLRYQTPCEAASPQVFLPTTRPSRIRLHGCVNLLQALRKALFVCDYVSTPGAQP